MDVLIIDMISVQGTAEAEVEVEGRSWDEVEGPGGRPWLGGIEDWEVSALDDSDSAQREPALLCLSEARLDKSSDSREGEMGED